MSQRPMSFPLSGGMDLITPADRKRPGTVIASLNYLPVATGYQRLRGYERYDGRTAPSAATYWRLGFTGYGFTGVTATVGNKYWNTSANSCYLVATVITSGSFANGNAAGYFIVTNLTGNMVPSMNTGASGGQNVATITTQTLEYDFGAAQNAIYRAAAAEVARSTITAVTGSGPIRGIWGFNGQIIAFRDDAGGTTGVAWKASTSGWTAASNLTKLPFTVDTATQTMPVYSSKFTTTISNASSGASKGTLRGVVITSTVGTVNTGYLLISGYVASSWTAGGTGIWYSGTTTRVGTSSAAASTAATIPPGGRYFFLNHNFYGSSERAAMYAVNGVGKALAYDGVGFSEITTGMTTDTPTRLATHQGALFLAFPGGSLQLSQVGEPMVFDPTLGASEIAVGSDITDLIPANKTTLTIFAESSVSVLYGHDATDYQVEKLIEAEGDEAVALPYTAQRVNTVIYMDNVGIRSISATAAFGNFSTGTISRMIEPLLADYRRDGVSPVASLVWKRNDQYWVFFDNGTALVVYLGAKDPQIMPLNLGFTVTCATTITVAGIERAFVGTSTGYVMELDKGTSFDGVAMEYYVRLPFFDFGSPELEKRIHKVLIDLKADGTTSLSAEIGFDFGFVSSLPSQTFSVTTGGGALDDLGSNELYYATQIETQGELYADGVARNFSLKIGSSTSTEEPHTLTSVSYLLTPLELKR